MADCKTIPHQIANPRDRVTPIDIRLALAEERERRRIARGPHDDFGKTLALVHGKLGASKSSAVGANLTLSPGTASQRITNATTFRAGKCQANGC